MIMELARNYRTLYAKEILKKAKVQLRKQAREQGRPEILSWLPGIRRTQELVSKARPNQREEGTLDAPWSMACLASTKPIKLTLLDAVLLAHATGRLLEIYRRCLIVGQRFTIRQAIWAARLADALPQADFSPLHSLAYRYASREKTALALDQPMDTSDLDAELAFIDMPVECRASGRVSLAPGLKEGTVRRLDNWEYQDAILAGYAKGPVRLSREEQLAARDASSAEAEESAQELMTWHDQGTLAWVEQEELGLPAPVTSLAERQMQAIAGPVPSEWKPRINEKNALVLSAANVTTLWLRSISLTPKWRAMSGQDQRNAAVQLETLVEKIAKFMAGPIFDKDSAQAHADLREFIRQFGLDPWPWLTENDKKRLSEKGERHDQTR